MSRFVRQSAYRHTFGTPAKREDCYDNVKISASAFDTNLVSASCKYLAVNWQASGGGAFLVTPLNQTGKLPDLFPLCRAHTAPVLDTHWSPFDDSLVASVGEDGKLALTKIDDSLLQDAWSGDHKDLPDLEPIWSTSAHARKAGHVRFHPSASNVLATASTDVKIWDLEHQKSVYTSETHADMVQSINWDWCGGVYATTCKDKKLRLFDPRSGSAPVTVADSHSGVKGARVTWLGSHDRLVTTGFSRSSERQVFMWDSRDITKGPIKQMGIDQSSGMLMPFFNAGNNILFVAGKGDGNIRMYEMKDDELFYLSDYTSPNPQRGLCLAPERASDVGSTEIVKAYKAAGNIIEPISFVVPRKSDSFQSDLFPPAPSDQPALSSSEWFGGKTLPPILIDMQTRQTSTSHDPTYVTYTPSISTPAPKAATPAREPSPPLPRREPSPPPQAPAPARQATPPPPPREPTPPPPAPAPVPATTTNGSSSSHSDESEKLSALREENADLKSRLAEKDSVIRELELKLEKIKAAFM
ncbi:uncharacterized protein JCM6883_000934 [Sporobolomyces salmoneus]|uniref:uncharacterized protein n=1 Tax=Sporobolomyces salmoneus TaxID=183962 RepID=UPI00316B384F